jgi:hypothetical protein
MIDFQIQLNSEMKGLAEKKENISARPKPITILNNYRKKTIFVNLIVA